jgi:hypothetical protein
MIILQLICDICKKVILEKEGESYLNQEKFPISNEEAMMLDNGYPSEPITYPFIKSTNCCCCKNAKKILLTFPLKKEL